MRADPPLVPDPRDAERLLRDELDGGAYTDSGVLAQLQEWLQDLFSEGSERTSGISQVQTVLAWVSALVLLGLLVYLLTRVRGARAAASGPRALLGDEVTTAAELRRRAERALAEGRHEEALVEGYRALALRQIEDDQVDDVPGATAQEVGRMLATAFPEAAGALLDTAARFDGVLYGRRRASAEQAGSVLGLDDALPGRVRR